MKVIFLNVSRFQRIAGVVLVLVAPSGCLAQNFQWNWRESRELTRRDSLRKAAIAQDDRLLLALAIEDQLRPGMVDLQINSEQQLRKAALDTAIVQIDLNNDGTPEVVAHATADCSPTGNCSFWIFQKTSRGYMAILTGSGQTFTVQRDRLNGYLGIVIAGHSSATQQGLDVYAYKAGRYRETACYVADWQILEGEQIHELKNPRIIPCRAP